MASSKQVEQKISRTIIVDMKVILREMKVSLLQRVPTKFMVADALTKRKTDKSRHEGILKESKCVR